MYPYTVERLKPQPVFGRGYVCLPVPKPKVDIPDGLQDRGEFHITLVEPPEVAKMVKQARTTRNLKYKDAEKLVRDFFINMEIRGEPQAIGLGKQSDGNNEVYFLVVKWPEAQAFRARIGLTEKDLHITIGFTHKDIFGVPKDETTLLK